MKLLYRCVCALDAISPVAFRISLCVTDSKFVRRVKMQKDKRKLVLFKYKNK